MTASWECRKSVRTADKGLWGNFINNATVQVGMPNASLHLAWEWTIHFPGEGSWMDTEAGTVELPFTIDVKCYDTLVVKTFEWSQGYRGVLRGDGSGSVWATSPGTPAHSAGQPQVGNACGSQLTLDRASVIAASMLSKCLAANPSIGVQLPPSSGSDRNCS